MNIFKCLFLSRISHCHWEDLHTIKLIGEELLYWQFPYKKPKTEIYILKSKRATLSSLAMREFTTKEDLNSYKEIGTSTYQFKTLVYLKIKKELFSMKKTFIQKIFVVLKLSAFYFEISSFSSISWLLPVSCCIYWRQYVKWLSFTLQEHIQNFWKAGI